MAIFDRWNVPTIVWIYLEVVFGTVIFDITVYSHLENNIVCIIGEIAHVIAINLRKEYKGMVKCKSSKGFLKRQVTPCKALD